jgi:uncharacterized membrane-anchored protein
MKTKTTPLLMLGLLMLATVVGAQEAPDESAIRAIMEKVAKGLKYQHGEITLSGGQAKINVPADFSFLDQADTKVVLEKLWGNPPDDDMLGMLIPANMNPLSSNCWAVTISFSDDGYVKDTDASKIDYNDLLKTMQKGTKAENKERKKQGYPTVELVGWAAPPRYDAEAKKLYWAKELKFEGADENTLNYDIRILGRRGVLVLTAIATVQQLPEIEQQAPKILGMVNFNDGHRYADFDPKSDKVAAYGIAALVAGGLAAKAGLFKVIFAALIAAKKLVIVAFVAIAAFVKKIFSGRSKN